MKYKIIQNGDVFSGYYADENGEYTEEESKRIITCQNINATEADYNKKVAELQADYDSKQYQRDRAVAYPSIQDQLDMQYWDAVNETTTWKDSIAKVKAENPKPES